MTTTKTLRGLLEAYSSGEINFDTLRVEASQVRLSSIKKDESYNSSNGESWDSNPDNSQALLASAVDAGIISHGQYDQIVRAIVSNP